MKMYLHHCRVTSTTDETTVIVNALGDILFWVIERSPTYVCTCTLDNAKKCISLCQCTVIVKIRRSVWYNYKVQENLNS